MNGVPETRESLLLQLCDPANQEAWDSFAQIYRPVVYRLARGRGMQDADAEDLTQQVLLAVSRSLPEWQRNPGTRFHHWLKRIARNAIVNALTRGPKDASVGGSDFLDIMRELPQQNGGSHVNDIDQQIEQEYHRQLYRTAAQIVHDSVHEDTWRAFVYTVVEGEATEVVAVRMGKTIGNVHAARSRIMRRLQATVKQLMEIDR